MAAPRRGGTRRPQDQVVAYIDPTATSWSMGVRRGRVDLGGVEGRRRGDHPRRLLRERDPCAVGALGPRCDASPSPSMAHMPNSCAAGSASLVWGEGEVQ